MPKTRNEIYDESVSNSLKGLGKVNWMDKFYFEQEVSLLLDFYKWIRYNVEEVDSIRVINEGEYYDKIHEIEKWKKLKGLK